MFRSFIYLDEEKMYSYLKQVDSEYANQPIEVNKKRTMGGSIGTGGIGVNAGTEVEERREFGKDIVKDYDRFENKLQDFAGSEYFDMVLEDYDLNTVPSMSIVRLNECFEIPEEFDMFSVAQNFMPLITSQIQTSSESEKEVMETYLGQASADIPIVIELDELAVAGKLGMRNLQEEYAQLEEYAEQEIFILCKVVGKMQKEKVEIFNPLKDFIKLPRAVRRGMDSKKNNMEPIVIDGPVLKVEVIAIYK